MGKGSDKAKKGIASAPVRIKGARVHNLKNIDLDIPRRKLVTITGVSGSGKSSLAFDLLYAEGQRRYVESLSAYARQFLGKLEKPDVDEIDGISPAIAIEQKAATKNPRSTVGTTTEVHEYLKLLFARVGRTYSPISGEMVKRDSPEDVKAFIEGFPEGTRGIIASNWTPGTERSPAEELQTLSQLGFSRLKTREGIKKVDDLNGDELDALKPLYLVIDRIVSRPEQEDNGNRLLDSARTAFFEGQGSCQVEMYPEDQDPVIKEFSDKAEKDGMRFEDPSTDLFSFNSPLGACPSCEGFGSVMGIDEDRVIPNKNLSVYEDAIVCWRGEKMSRWKQELVRNAHKFDFPIHRPIKDLTPAQRDLLWTGNEYFKGLDQFFAYLERKSYKIQYRVMISRYRGKSLCQECRGSRLRKEAQYVKVDGHDITELLLMPIGDCLDTVRSLDLKGADRKVADRLLIEIINRLQYLCDVGLGYLTLNRRSSTLSGGEAQRINLARALGSNLVGSLYILDEPSIGLHPKDNHRLIKVLKALRDMNNTVIVVEHDEAIMRASDHIIDLGPGAGSHGGEVVFTGDHEALLKEKFSLTAQYLTGREEIPLPSERREGKGWITIRGARQHNLKDIELSIPLGCLSVITGVSGSGKSTLVGETLYPALKKETGGQADKTGEFDAIEGDIKAIDAVEMVDQSPIGRSSRSNPVTYVKAFDEIRKLFASTQQAHINGLKAKDFSFNVKGGRCEVCEGDGEVHIEMQFMADISLTCDNCKGRRYKEEILEVEYRGKNIADVLEMTVDDAIAFFREEAGNKKLIQKLQPLKDVGLGYIALGQSSSTLSGGEAQRIKLASFLSQSRADEDRFFIFDEPTTGLHFHDIKNLLNAFNALIANGHTVVVIEHNPEVIKSADHLVDLGPEGGEKGGYVVFTGKPEAIVGCKDSHTAAYLSDKLATVAE